MSYYLAYGSNLNVRNMAVRCPAARKVGGVRLDDHRLVFRRVADIERFKGASVDLGVWEITDQCEAALDVYEGVRTFMYRKAYLPIEVDGKIADALFYVMLSDGYAPPSAHYLHVIEQGYRDFGFPVERLYQALIDQMSFAREASHDKRRTASLSHEAGAPIARPGRPNSRRKPAHGQRMAKAKNVEKR